MKRIPLSLDTTAFTGWSFILGGVPLVVGAVAIEHAEWRPIGTPSMIGLVYNIIVAFLLCHWLWFRLVTLAPAGALALGTLAIPVIGVFLRHAGSRRTTRLDRVRRARPRALGVGDGADPASESDHSSRGRRRSLTRRRPVAGKLPHRLRDEASGHHEPTTRRHGSHHP